MIGTLVLVITVALAATALFGLVTTVTNRPPGRVHRIAVGICEVLVVVQAAVAVYLVLVNGVTLPEETTFLIYVLVSVCLLPIALQFATASDATAAAVTDPGATPAASAAPAGADAGPSRWGGAVIAAGAIGTLVVVLRLQGLWSPVG